MSHRITERIAQWVAAAIEGHDQGDEILWDVAMVVTNRGPGVVLLVTMKGAVLDTVIHNQMLIESPTVADREGIDRAVQGLLDGLRQERSRQLGAGNGGLATPLPGKGLLT